MGELNFSFSNGPVAGEYENELTKTSSNMARRSRSIFSRRGTDKRKSRPSYISLQYMPAAEQTSEKQSRISRRLDPYRSYLRSPTPSPQPTPRPEDDQGRQSFLTGPTSSPKEARSVSRELKGTILNAVPPAKTIEMTALEKEMATSPNDEIISAIIGLSPTAIACSPTSQRRPSSAQEERIWRSQSTLVSKSQLERRRTSNARIGVWVNGVAHWDEPDEERNADEPAQIDRHTQKTSPLRNKPTLSVQIPTGRQELDLPVIVHPRPQRPINSAAPAGTLSKFAVPIPVASPNEIWPESLSPYPAIPPRRRPAQRLSDASTRSSNEEFAGKHQAESTDGSSAERDDSSIYSKQSSATSTNFHDIGGASEKGSSSSINDTLVLFSASNSKKSTPVNFSDQTKNNRGLDEEKPLPPFPTAFPSPLLIESPSGDKELSQKSQLKYSESPRSLNSHSKSQLRAHKINPRRSLRQLDMMDIEFIRCSPYNVDIEPEPVSPELSQAEQDLTMQLSTISETVSMDNRKFQENTLGSGIKRTDSVHSVTHPPMRAPTLPKRSRKREWRDSAPRGQSARLTKEKGVRRRRSDSSLKMHSDKTQSDLHRSTSAVDFSKSPAFSELVRMSSVRRPKPEPMFIVDDGLIVVHGPMAIRAMEQLNVLSPAEAAEDVLLRTLASLDAMADLFNTATINKGMYRIYKENEMHLIRTVTFNESPPAWEFREWSPLERKKVVSKKASSQPYHTPRSYVSCYNRDLAIINSLKDFVHKQCQTFIRRETASAISGATHKNSQRFTDAFWRIWCFCKIFGCQKGREDDVTGQLDWLKGGILAENQGCVATVNTNLEFDMSSVLLNAPDYFAAGNANGLDDQQLYDMTEIWTCLSCLLQGYHGRTEEARKSGVFKNCDVKAGDVEKEEIMLEEWTYYLLTLGLTVILDMAKHASCENSSGFALAKENGWTEWSPPEYNGSRATFLKEPVARLYEERMTVAALARQSPVEMEKKEMGRKRVATLAAEIRLRRQASSYKSQPLIDMHNERPMSMTSRQNSIASSHGGVSSIAPTPCCTSPVQMTPSRPAIARPWSPRKISPIIEDRVESFNRLSLHNKMALQAFAGVAEDTSERAVYRIVEMGFTPAEAKMALRVTDMGDGLRIDRAVDFLMRQRG
ncbi:Hypothetical protein R9X50_00033700 [Acrodontium crateriforme]|uniref:UBA domain-containing protein n=1 Tax=Acrodontium crateriforme TaxID=150365 RepID=A0AAQ3R1Y9_9PEZI|nr:Hypothetical protein R9X50_00033700 [Acrodontium crateriforme]